MPHQPHASAWPHNPPPRPCPLSLPSPSCHAHPAHSPRVRRGWAWHSATWGCACLLQKVKAHEGGQQHPHDECARVLEPLLLPLAARRGRGSGAARQLRRRDESPSREWPSLAKGRDHAVASRTRGSCIMASQRNGRPPRGSATRPPARQHGRAAGVVLCVILWGRAVSHVAQTAVALAVAACHFKRTARPQFLTCARS